MQQTLADVAAWIYGALDGFDARKDVGICRNFLAGFEGGASKECIRHHRPIATIPCQHSISHTNERDRAELASPLN